MRTIVAVLGLVLSGCGSVEQRAYEDTKAEYNGRNRAENEIAMEQFPTAGITKDMTEAERTDRINRYNAEISLKVQEMMDRMSKTKDPEEIRRITQEIADLGKTKVP